MASNFSDIGAIDRAKAILWLHNQIVNYTIPSRGPVHVRIPQAKPIYSFYGKPEKFNYERCYWQA